VENSVETFPFSPLQIMQVILPRAIHVTYGICSKRQTESRRRTRPRR
jgi:hypothetical protein